MTLEDGLLGVATALQSGDLTARARVVSAEKDPRIGRKALHYYRALQEELFLHFHEVLKQCREIATLSDLPEEVEKKLAGVMKQLQLEVLQGLLMQQHATLLLDAMLEGPDREGPDAPLPKGMPDLVSIAREEIEMKPEEQTEKKPPAA
jgi:hypothetical protein